MSAINGDKKEVDEQRDDKIKVLLQLLPGSSTIDTVLNMANLINLEWERHKGDDR